jgi:hypothetical protein
MTASTAFALVGKTGHGRGYFEPLHVHPPRAGLRPGTAAGNPLTPF